MPDRRLAAAALRSLALRRRREATGALGSRLGLLRRRRGVTLVEVLVVVAIMALVASGAAVLVFGHLHRTRVKKAAMDAKTIQGAAALYRHVESRDDCPPVTRLVELHKLSRDSVADPWSSEYLVECEQSEVLVTSAGRDRQPGTADDIRSDFTEAEITRVADL